MANDTVTSQPCFLLFSNDPKWERRGEAHLSYYTSTYNRVETSQPPQDLHRASNTSLHYQFNVISFVTAVLQFLKVIT